LKHARPDIELVEVNAKLAVRRQGLIAQGEPPAQLFSRNVEKNQLGIGSELRSSRPEPIPFDLY